MTSLDELGKTWREYQAAQAGTDQAVEDLRVRLAEERAAAASAVRAALALSGDIIRRRGGKHA